MNKISVRLEAVANYVDDNSKVIDIGCDHGFLSIFLAKKYDNIKIIASDINENALGNAIENINKSSFSGMNLYKHMSINDFVKEVDVEYDNISKSNNPKDRARFCAIENTVSIYKKHYQSYS